MSRGYSPEVKAMIDILLEIFAQNLILSQTMDVTPLTN